LKGDIFMAGSYWDKFTKQRISRRRALQGTAVTGMAAGAVWLVGCGTDDDDDDNGDGTPTNGDVTPTNGNGEDEIGLRFLNEKDPPEHGGTLVMREGSDFETWDAHVSVAASAQWFPQIYNLLVNQSSVDPNFFFFDLAESFENPDENTWNFQIRDGVMIGPNDLGVDERAMDAEDARASWQRVKDEPQAGAGAIKPFLDTISANGNTLTINTTEPYAWLLYRMGLFTGTIPPRELTEDPERMFTRSAGGGAFRLAESVEAEVARMVRNPSYYRRDERNNNEQLPYRDGVDLLVIRERGTTRTQFRDGAIHIYGAESREDAEDIARGGDFFINRNPATTFISFAMNPEREPFTDDRVRRAVGLAINRQAFVDRIYGGEAEANGLVHWPTGDYAFRGAELDEVQPYDPDEARALVEAVGGIRFAMMYPSQSDVQQHDQHLPIFLEQMADVGIVVDQDAQDFGTWYSNYQTLNYVASLSLNQSYENPEIPLDAHHSLGVLGDRSFFVGIGDPEIDAAIEGTKAAFELEERIQRVREAQLLIYDKGPAWLPLVTPFGYTVYNGRLHNVATGLGPATNALVNFSMWMEA
jgi:peptide/nickel transport system substrate-binding protein